MAKPKKERKPTLTQGEKEEIKNFFNSNGLTFTEWAMERGFKAVYTAPY